MTLRVPFWSRHAANALTAYRVVAAPVFATAVLSKEPWHGVLAAALFCGAAVSDVYDGRLARYFGQASTGGRVFDHFADIGFLLVSYSALVVAGLVPWWVPGAIGTSFLVYVIDSLWRPAPLRAGLVGSRIGHFGGIANYVVLGVVTFDAVVGLRVLPDVIHRLLFAAVPLYSGASVAVRLFSARTTTD